MSRYWVPAVRWGWVVPVWGRAWSQRVVSRTRRPTGQCTGLHCHWLARWWTAARTAPLHTDRPQHSRVHSPCNNFIASNTSHQTANHSTEQQRAFIHCRKTPRVLSDENRNIQCNINHYMICIVYTAPSALLRAAIGTVLSVCLSVCLSVRHAVV